MITETDPLTGEPLAETKTQQALQSADVYIRENPIPTVLCAVAIGFGLGLLVRVLEPRRSRWEESVDDAEGLFHSVFNPVAKKTRRAYHRSSDAVRDAMHNVRDVDVDDYVDPVVSWFQRLWKRSPF